MACLELKDTVRLVLLFTLILCPFYRQWKLISYAFLDQRQRCTNVNVLPHFNVIPFTFVSCSSIPSSQDLDTKNSFVFSNVFSYNLAWTAFDHLTICVWKFLNLLMRWKCAHLLCMCACDAWFKIRIRRLAYLFLSTKTNCGKCYVFYTCTKATLQWFSIGSLK